jgi:uncharacterized membrane protein HdeD (DUF308 family)
MPWKIKKQIYLILLGCLAIILGVVVFIGNFHDWTSDVLGVVAVVGGVAIIINSLPANGNGDKKE